MSHRAQQIVEAIVTALQANTSLGAAVYQHRHYSVGEDAQELPCVSVSIGADNPLSDLGVENMGFIDSLLEVSIAATARGDDEQSAIEALLALRRQIHITLMADRSLGLAFVVDTRYGGAQAPDFDVGADRIAARLEMRWPVHYRMAISDPA